jgi:hypothetical protein
MNLRKNCAQLSQSISAANEGNALPFTRWNTRPSSNGRITSTAVPFFCAAGSSRFSAPRRPIELGSCTKSTPSRSMIRSRSSNAPSS